MHIVSKSNIKIIIRKFTIQIGSQFTSDRKRCPRVCLTSHTQPRCSCPGYRSLTRSTSRCVAMSPFVVHASKRDREMTCAAQAARGGAGGGEEEQGAGWSFTSRNRLRLQGKEWNNRGGGTNFEHRLSPSFRLFGASSSPRPWLEPLSRPTRLR